MPGSRMQCLEFLMLSVLAAGALANSKDTCACKCSGFDVCDTVRDHDSKVVSQEEQLVKYRPIVADARKFLDGKEREISDVVKKLVERNINSVLKNAVADLGISSGNPEGSNEPASALERTRDYLTRIFKVMEDFSSELKETSNRAQRLSDEQEGVGKGWADEREQLSDKLKEVKKLSEEQKEKLSEMSPRLKEMEDKFTLYKDITEIQKTIENLTSEIIGANGKEIAPIGGKCPDEAYPEYCKQIVEAKLCTTEYYRKICCASCTKSGQLPSNWTGET